MPRRDDQIIVSFFTSDQPWSAPTGVGVLPPTDEFVPGDLVSFAGRSDCVGLIVARRACNVEYEGLSAMTHENIRDACDKGLPVRGTAKIDFYTVVWNTGTVKTAGAHQLDQLRRVTE